LRWRRNRSSAICGYRPRRHWRGRRPRVSSQVRDLITQMARENFLRVRHGSMASFPSHARVHSFASHHIALPACTKQKANTVVADRSSQSSDDVRSLYQGAIEGETPACILGPPQSIRDCPNPRVDVGRRRGFSEPTLKVGRISLRSARCDRGLTHRAASVSGGSSRALCNRSGAALPIRSPPR